MMCMLVCAPDYQDAEGRTPVHLAAVSRSQPLMKLLLKAKGYVLLPDVTGVTAAGISMVRGT